MPARAPFDRERAEPRSVVGRRRAAGALESPAEQLGGAAVERAAATVDNRRHDVLSLSADEIALLLTHRRRPRGAAAGVGVDGAEA